MPTNQRSNPIKIVFEPVGGAMSRRRELKGEKRKPRPRRKYGGF
jgi:hypothetical protein